MAPTTLWASTDGPPPELTSFAYAKSHPVTPLPDAVLDRISDSPAPDEARAYAPSPLPVEARHEPRALTRSAVCSTVASIAHANDLPVPFFANLIWQESNFDTQSVSRAGAQGIAQFMPKTAAEVGLMNPFEPIQALHAAGRFLRQLREQFGNLGLAAAAYNAGPGRVIDWISRRKALPGETRNYVLRITGHPADRWTARNAQHDPEVRLMPARAPCVEVAQAVAHQVETVRVTRLMSELAAATAGDRHDDAAALVADAAPQRKRSALKLANTALKAHRQQPTKTQLARAEGHDAAAMAPTRLAANSVAKAAKSSAKAAPRLAKATAPRLAKAAAPRLAKAAAPKVARASTPKQGKAVAAHTHAPSHRTRVASAR